jgi:GH18 family chitinase
VHDKLDAIARGEIYLARELSEMAADLTDITREVTETQDAQAAAVTLLNDLKARLDAAGTDPVKLKELSDALDSSTNALAAAVVANTPAAAPGNDTQPG